MSNQIIVVDPLERIDLLKSLASEVRVRILSLLNSSGPRNVNQVAEELGLPQSTISANIQVLVDCGPCPDQVSTCTQGKSKDLLLDIFGVADRISRTRCPPRIQTPSK